MDPYSGDVYELRRSLLGDAEPGDRIALDEFREKVAKLEDASRDEVLAMRASGLVAVEQEVARKLVLGERERERRRRRRKAEKRARRASR